MTNRFSSRPIPVHFNRFNDRDFSARSEPFLALASGLEKDLVELEQRHESPSIIFRDRNSKSQTGASLVRSFYKSQTSLPDPESCDPFETGADLAFDARWI